MFGWRNPSDPILGADIDIFVYLFISLFFYLFFFLCENDKNSEN